MGGGHYVKPVSRGSRRDRYRVQITQCAGHDGTSDATPHLSALMLLVDNYTIVGHARKYLHLPNTTASSVSCGGAARVA